MAADAEKVPLPGGRHCRVSKPIEEVQIDAKATFRVRGNAMYRKLLDRFANGAPIECKTADGIEFELVT
jgi:hypothetical protein